VKAVKAAKSVKAAKAAKPTKPGAKAGARSSSMPASAVLPVAKVAPTAEPAPALALAVPVPATPAPLPFGRPRLTDVSRGPSPHGMHGMPIAPVGPPRPEFTFSVGDKCVHPAHGVGEITAIEKRELGGTTGLFYTLKILDNGMKVMVPVGAGAQVGLRPIMSAKEADSVLDTMRAREVAVDLHPWSRRFRAYTDMIKTGSPHEIAKVLRDMYRLKFDKDLSFGERRLLDQAKSLLLKELAFAKKTTEAEMAADVAKMFTA
jgi:CarD family transcriptional regulator